jgi:hypothetical protein
MLEPMTYTWWWISLALLIVGFAASLAAIYQGTKNAYVLTEDKTEGTWSLTSPETRRDRIRAGALPGIALALATLGGLAGLLASPPA